ncbi:MAG: family 43 glycosylhydrolase [Bacteroidaceae bacterium]|nr:family 43 glycosylhydrolase [Bacteroidaceae bacterium]
MKKKILLAVCCLWSVVCLHAQNPIVSHCYTADPAPMVFEGNDSLYVYCDEDMNVPGVNDFYYMERWRVYSTVDMVNWTDHGIAMPRTAFAWGREGTCWASQCVKNGEYYYWFMCLSKPNDWRHYIGLGRSKKPSGPFRDVLRKPLIDTGEGGDIDPTVFIDDDGKAYLYWGNNKLRYAQLGSLMVTINTHIGNNGIVDVPLTEEAFGGVKVDDRVTGKDCYEEGPWLDKRGDKYYLMYAAGGVPEHISYSMSDSPTGPWTYKGIVMRQQDTGSFTNHSGMVHYQGKDYFFYHTGWAKGGGGFNRSMAVEEMHFNSDGTIQPVTATRKGVQALRTLSPYIPQQAETLNAAMGVSVVGNESTGVYVTDIHSGDSMRVANVDFGTEGAKSITLRVASANGKGTLVIRKDNARGTVLARIPIAATGDDQLWEERTFDLTNVPQGIHAVHFSFTGASTSTLFNWDWWQFNEFTSEIEAVNRSSRESSPIFYTLQGVPVINPTIGIYIKDGKKVLIP